MTEQGDAGVELDREIERRIFGRKTERLTSLGHRAGNIVIGETHIAVPAYSTDMAAAWEIVEHLMVWADRGYTFGSGTWPDGRRYHTARFFPRGYSRAWLGDADTLPLAICRAALLAVGDTA
jgi:hypothetical protein